MRTCYVIGDDLLTELCIESIIENACWKLLGIISTSNQLKEKWMTRFPVYETLTEFKEKIIKHSFDYLFSIVNYRVVPEDVLNLPKFLAVNYHSSPLPKYAGWDPISWAILNNEKFYGITWHVMNKKIDFGKLILEVPISIDLNETALTLRTKCFESALKSFPSLLNLLDASFFKVRTGSVRVVNEKNAPDIDIRSKKR